MVNETLCSAPGCKEVVAPASGFLVQVQRFRGTVHSEVCVLAFVKAVLEEVHAEREHEAAVREQQDTKLAFLDHECAPDCSHPLHALTGLPRPEKEDTVEEG